MRFELSLAIATSASEISRGRAACSGSKCSASFTSSQDHVGLYFNDDDAKGLQTEDSLTSAKVPVTRKMGKGTEVIGLSGDGHFALICLTLMILKPNSSGAAVTSSDEVFIGR